MHCERPEGVCRYRAAPCWVIMPQCCGLSFQIHSLWVVRREASLLLPLAGISRPVENGKPAPPNRFQHCSGHEIVCVCLCVSPALVFSTFPW